MLDFPSGYGKTYLGTLVFYLQEKKNMSSKTETDCSSGLSEGEAALLHSYLARKRQTFEASGLSYSEANLTEVWKKLYRPKPRRIDPAEEKRAKEHQEKLEAYFATHRNI